MNNKGFTTIELVLTIVLVIIIMGTITNVTYTYRDTASYEETKTSIINYKNTLTKIIYDDIFLEKVVSIEEVNNDNISLIKENGDKIELSLINLENEVGILYNGVKYIIPESDDGLIVMKGMNVKRNDEIKMYTVDIIFHHIVLETDYSIHFMVS